MYGTVARMVAKDGMMDQLRSYAQEINREIAGMAFEYVYRADTNPNELWIVVAFDSREAYVKNAESPEQHQRYLRMREMLDRDPEWHDGEIVDSFVGAGRDVSMRA